VILDELVALSGQHRDHARQALRVATPPGVERLPRKRWEPVLVYGEAMIAALRVCWATLDGATGSGWRRACRSWSPRYSGRCVGTQTAGAPTHRYATGAARSTALTV
jgi:hypothetical protein